MGRPKKSKGLGDTIEKITEATGIKAVVEAVSEATGLNCGCEARKEKLNKLFPYKKPECLTDEDSEWLANFFSTTNNQLTPKQQNRIIDIYKNVFNQNIQPSNCGSCWRDRVNELKKVYETQNK
jgi:predicted Zn-ribbon and HTH transcriptional regulator